MFLKIKVNCDDQRCQAKNSMVAVSYLDKQRKADRVCFYFCSKCSVISQLHRIPFNKEISGFQVFIIKGRGGYDILEMQRDHKPSCVFCSNSVIRYRQYRKLTEKEAKEHLKIDIEKGSNSDGLKCRTYLYFVENMEKPYFVNKNSVVKLYIESKRLEIPRTFAGYLCLSCNKICFVENLPSINWKILPELSYYEHVIPKNDTPGSQDKLIKYGSLGWFSRQLGL